MKTFIIISQAQNSIKKFNSVVVMYNVHVHLVSMILHQITGEKVQILSKTINRFILAEHIEVTKFQHFHKRK